MKLKVIFHQILSLKQRVSHKRDLGKSIGVHRKWAVTGM